MADQFWHPVMGAVDTIASDIQKRKEREMQLEQDRAKEERMNKREDFEFERKTGKELDFKQMKNAYDYYSDIETDPYSTPAMKKNARAQKMQLSNIQGEEPQEVKTIVPEWLKAAFPEADLENSSQHVVDELAKNYETRRSNMAREAISRNKPSSAKVPPSPRQKYYEDVIGGLEKQLNKIQSETKMVGANLYDPDEADVKKATAIRTIIDDLNVYIKNGMEGPEPDRNIGRKIVLQEIQRAKIKRLRERANIPAMGQGAQPQMDGEQEIPPEIQHLPPEDQQEIMKLVQEGFDIRAILKSYYKQNGTPR